MAQQHRNKTRKIWKRIYSKRYRRLLKRNRDRISKGCFRHTLTGHRWYDLYD